MTAFDKHLEANRHRMKRREPEFCRCCGAPEGTDCDCDVQRFSGNDPETGYWEEDACVSHERRV
jgi:hypothetical protein